MESLFKGQANLNISAAKEKEVKHAKSVGLL